MADGTNEGADNNGLEELAEKLAELGLKLDPISKAIDAGHLMVKPKDIDSLPDDIKKLIDEKIQEGKQEASKISKDQLYDTIEKLKKDNAELKKLVDAEIEKKQKIEQEEAAKKEAEEKNKMTPDEKVQKAIEEMRSKIDQQKSENDNKVLELARKLKIAEQKVVLEKIKSKYGDQIIPELIPDLETNPDISEEDLAAKVEFAHNKFVEIFNAGKGAVEDQSPSQVGRKATPLKSTGTESNIPNNRKPVVDIDLLKKSKSLDEVNKVIEQISAANGI